MIPTSASRVSAHTKASLNYKIHQQTEANIAYFTNHPAEIEWRLSELDEEWDVERMLETGSSVVSLLGLALGLTRSRKWLLVPLVVQGFFLQHALQGWCPPLPILRKLGFRTQYEIEEERYALKALRGDFQLRGGHAAFG